MKLFIRIVWIIFRVIILTFRVCSRILWNASKKPLYARTIPMQNWGPKLVKLAHVKLTFEGTEHIDPEQSYIFVMNHQSMIDIPVAYCVLPVSICFVVKQELKKIPMFGHSMASLGMIFVDRKNPKRAYQSLLDGAALIQSGINVMAFPEGTRSKDGVIKPFKKGIFLLAKQAKVPIIPMAIEGAQDVLSKKGLLQKTHLVHVKIGQPIDPRVFEHKDEKELSQYAYEQVVLLHQSMLDS
jgi:1-acyl-sn-glycerol-3-phosphate acyltransferase